MASAPAASSRATKRKATKKKKKDTLNLADVYQDRDYVVPFNLAVCALGVISLFYAGLLFLARRSIYAMYMSPLPLNASLDTFSEGRVMKHVWHLAHEIGIRQEGSVGLIQASDYIKSELHAYKQRSSVNMRVEIDESFVSGSFSMMFLKHSIALSYRNHNNIAIRISAADADEDAPALLVNGHFDSAIGSPGAGDCASCVASMLEAVRLIVDTNWVPPKPIIFLFNGAEELFMVACHGFMTTHKWRSTVGALINIEASGNGGPDLVCQSGPGPWPAEVYAKTAIHPMANTPAQDIFPHIPGDTDYRMFSEDYGDIPGLDIILLLGSYVYHTPYDLPDKMVPGSMQLRGENLMSLLKAFTNSSNLMSSKDRIRAKNQTVRTTEKRPIFFDFLGWFMIYYPFNTALALHTLPLGFVLLVASLTSFEVSGVESMVERITFMLKGGLLHIAEMILGLLFPIVFAVLRLLPCSTSMTWFSRPWLVFILYVPISVAGMLLPRTIFGEELMVKGASDRSRNKKAVDWGIQWGTMALYSLTAAIGTHFLGNGFLSLCWFVFLLLGHYILQLSQKTFGKQSILTFLIYIVTTAFPALLSLYFGGILWQVLEEKMSMTGSVPQPLGFFIPDIVMAAITGYVVFLSFGGLVSVAGRWLCSLHIVRILIYVSAVAAAVSPQFFPYSYDAPKRVLLQHTLETRGNQIIGSHYDVAVMDSNSLPFVFNHIPEISSFVNLSSSFDAKTSQRSPTGTWTALYPIPHLFAESFRFPADSKDVLLNHPVLPHMKIQNAKHSQNGNLKRIHFELDLGSVNEVWAAVLNVTGPLASWSFSDGILPAPETLNGGPPSYICRLSGSDPKENWKFWLEADKLSVLRIDLAVLDQQLEKETRKFVHLFPSWTAVVAGSSYLSSYVV